MIVSRIRFFLIFILAITQYVSADVIVIGDARHEGTFTGFDNNNFEFDLKDGKKLKTNRTKVKALELSKPAKVSFEERGKKETEETQLLRYEKFKFIFQENGKEIGVIGSQVKNITKALVFEGTGGGGTSSTEIPSAPPLVEFSGMENAELTPVQKTTLAAYKAARANYEKFLAESTALVKEMDASEGERREALLNKLRARKQDEQPLLSVLQKATADVLAAFPPAPEVEK